MSLALTGAGRDGVVALSEAWKPGGYGAEPVRFFYLVADREAGPRMPMLPRGWPIRARMADGRVVTLPR